MPSVTKIRRGTTAGWTNADASGNHLAAGQLGYNKDTKELKVGDDSTAFADLPNIMAGVDPNIYKSTGIFFPSGSSTIQVNGSGASSEAEPLTINLSNPVGSSIYASFKFGKDSGSTMSKFYDANSTTDSPAGTLGTAANPWYGFWGDLCTVNNIVARNNTAISFRNDISFFGGQTRKISGYNVVIQGGGSKIDIGQGANQNVTIAANPSAGGVLFAPSGMFPVGPDGYDDNSYQAALGSSSNPWALLWAKSFSNNDNISINAIGANGADMKQITLRLSTADEDPSGIRSITFDSSSFSNYGSTLSLGTAENPWKDAYVANSIYMEDVGSGAAVPGMSIRYNADEEAIEFLAE